MSGHSTPRGMASQPKQISSRLLNMKFMQRASATEKNKLQISSTTSSPRTPTSASAPPFKRRRTGDHFTTLDSPVTPSTPLSSNHIANAAFKSDIEPPLSSSTRGGRNNFDTDAIETEWVLDVHLPTVNLSHGLSAHAYSTYGQGQGSEDEIDTEDTEDEIWNPSNPSGRQTYGSFKKKKKPYNATTAASSSTPNTPTVGSASKSAKRNVARKPNDFSALPGSNPSPNSKTDSDHDSNLDSGSASDDVEDEDDRSSSEDGEASSSGSSSSQAKKKPKIDFSSEEYLRKIDSMDFSRPGVSPGIGRQRMGLGQQSQHHSQSGRGGGKGGGGLNHKERRKMERQERFGKKK